MVFEKYADDHSRYDLRASKIFIQMNRITMLFLYVRSVHNGGKEKGHKCVKIHSFFF